MNLLNEFTENEKILIKQAGVYLEDKDYSVDELKIIEREITEYIMNHSSKNGSIGKLQNDYYSIYKVLGIK